METFISDSALFYKSDKQILIGICLTYLDDTLHTGNRDYVKSSNEAELKLECKGLVRDSSQFTGLQVEK